jgi:predicted TIM-barrel fold metal-dependent hydrolase
MALERFDRSHETHTQVDPKDEMLLLPQDEKISDYAVGLMKAGRMFVGCEGNELTLASTTKLLGSESLMYSSDFPHEVNNAYCKHEIHEFLTSEEFTEPEKQAILHGNAERFYGLA